MSTDDLQFIDTVQKFSTSEEAERYKVHERIAVNLDSVESAKKILLNTSISPRAKGLVRSMALRSIEFVGRLLNDSYDLLADEEVQRYTAKLRKCFQEIATTPDQQTAS